MFKVLILSYYFPPMGLSGVQRLTKFVKYMPDFGWEPTVIAPGHTPYFAYDLSLLDEIKNENIHIIRTSELDIHKISEGKYTVPLKREYFRKILSNASKALLIPDNKIFWAKKVARIAREELKNNHYDALFVSLPPFSIFKIAANLKAEFNLPLIVDYRDAWLSNQFAFYPTPMHRRIVKKMESELLRKADKVITINRKIKERMLLQYPFLNHDDIELLPQGFDSADFEQVLPIKRKDQKIHLTYAGTFYENITPKYLFKAFRRLLNESPGIASNFKLNFIGLLRKEHRKLIYKMKLEPYVQIYGYIPHKDVVEHLISSDVLWMTVGSGKRSEIITTGKLFEYFGSCKPVLAMVPEGAAKLNAAEYGASIITAPEDIEAIKTALIKIYNLHKNNKLPKPADKFVQKFDRRYQTEWLMKIFQKYLREPE